MSATVPTLDEFEGGEKDPGGTVAEIKDFNVQIIDQFRANGGNVGGPFEGAPMLLLHHRGAQSGTERVSPVMYQQLGDAWAIFASKGGAPTNPAWYYNLLAHPESTIEVGTESIPVVARVAGDDERSPIWEQQKQIAPAFAEYERQVSRQIPVVILERRVK